MCTVIWVKVILGYCLFVIVFIGWVSRVAGSCRIEED
jgi:hypothetical protein